MSKIKICHFILGFHNGGVEKVIENYFSNMDRSQYELHIVTHMEPDLNRQRIFENMGFIIHQLSYVHGHKVSKKNIKEYDNFFKQNKFDIVHNHFPENLLPLLFAKRYKVPIRILHSHSDYKNAFKEKHIWIKGAYLIGLRINTYNATNYFACGKVAAESVFGKKNINKTTIIINAIDTEKFKYDLLTRKKIRDQLKVNDSLVLGHTGRYEDIKIKNQSFVLKVFKEVLKTEPNARLLMIGEGKLRKDIMKLADDMEISDKVIFTGAVNNVYAYLQALDVFIFPSKFEGLGIAAVEAQCSGLPVIASSAIPEEANLTSVFHSISLSSPIENWAELVMNVAAHKRVDQSQIIKEQGYDIYQAASKLEKLYEKLYTERNKR